MYGASYPNEIDYRQHIEQLVGENSLRHPPTISRPKLAPQLPDDTGRAEDFFSTECLDALETALDLKAGQMGVV